MSTWNFSAPYFLHFILHVFTKFYYNSLHIYHVYFICLFYNNPQILFQPTWNGSCYNLTTEMVLPDGFSASETVPKLHLLIFHKFDILSCIFWDISCCCLSLQEFIQPLPGLRNCSRIDLYWWSFVSDN